MIQGFFKILDFYSFSRLMGSRSRKSRLDLDLDLDLYLVLKMMFRRCILPLSFPLYHTPLKVYSSLASGIQFTDQTKV